MSFASGRSFILLADQLFADIVEPWVSIVFFQRSQETTFGNRHELVVRLLQEEVRFDLGFDVGLQELLVMREHSFDDLEGRCWDTFFGD